MYITSSQLDPSRTSDATALRRYGATARRRDGANALAPDPADGHPLRQRRTPWRPKIWGRDQEVLRSDTTITGWWYTYPSEKYQSIGMNIPNIWENKKCSKPPTRCGLYHT